MLLRPKFHNYDLCNNGIFIYSTIVQQNCSAVSGATIYGTKQLMFNVDVINVRNENEQ